MQRRADHVGIARAPHSAAGSSTRLALSAALRAQPVAGWSCWVCPAPSPGAAGLFGRCWSNALAMCRAALQLAVLSLSSSALHGSCSPPCSQHAFSVGARAGLRLLSAAAGVQHLQVSFRSAGSGCSFH